MIKDLAGISFIYNGISMDYCFIESIDSLLEFCDHVYVVECNSTDGTRQEIFTKYSNNEMVTIITEEWELHHGKEKLAYFGNVGIKQAEKDGYKYVYCCQSDELTHEKSYGQIRDAIKGECEGYMCSRINLWQSPYLKLDVPQERKPCSTSVIRLAKSCYRSVDDSENIGAPIVDTYYESGIRIYHMGFVRKREIMPNKIRYIQQQVFGMEHADSKLDGMEIFDPTKWFDPKTDLKPIDEPLPKLIQKWAKERYYDD